MSINLSDEQQKALEAVVDGKNIFVEGVAGTGKSVIITKILDKNTILCAPTGMAALNIGGATCHRIFGLPFGGVSKKDLEKTPKKNDRFIWARK